jgi:TP901 family phage tail tape measure protein
VAEKRSVGVRLRMWVDQYKRDAEEARKANEKVGESGKKGRKDLDQLAGGLTIVGGLLTAAAAASVLTAAKFDKSMSEVKAVSGATTEEFERLRKAALDAGASTVFSASEAADAMGELAKAGVVVDDILAGGLLGTLDLAAAGTLDLSEAATIAAKTMNTFGLGGRDVSHIADVLAAAANKSATSVQELGIGLQQVGLVANQVGFSMEETVGLLAAFADRGLAGSDGATSLKTALLRLAAPIGEAQELLDQYGISLYDANGNMVDAVTIAGQLQTGLMHLSAAERNAAFNTIFGADAIRAANVLYSLGADGVREYIDAVNDQGAASRVAAEKLNNLAGDVKLFQSALEGLLINSAEGVTGPLRGFTQGVTNVVNAVGGLPPALQSTATWIAGVSGAMLLGTAATIKARSGFVSMAESLEAIGPAGKRAATGLRAVGTAATIAGVAITGALIAGQVIDAMIEDELNPNLESFAAGLKYWRQGAKLTGEAARVLGEDFGDLDKAMAVLAQSPRWITGLLGTLQDFGAQGGTNIRAYQEAVSAFDTTLADMVRSGNIERANALFNQQAQKFEAAGIPVEKLKALLPQYTGALDALTAEQVEAAESTEHLTRAQLAAVESGEKLADVWGILHGRAVTLDDEMLDAIEAVDGVREAFERNGPAIDGMTEAAIRNRLAMADAALQAVEAADAFIENGGSAEDAAAMLNQFKEDAIAAAVAAGGSADEVRRLAEELFRLPEHRTVTVTTRYTLQGDPVRPYGGGVFEREGGIVHAATGRLQPTIVDSPTVIFGERETEQEAYVPKRGDHSRALAILSEAAGWHGAQVVPRGQMSVATAAAAPVQVNITVSPAPGLGGAIVDGLRFDTEMVGAGSVQTHMGTRGRYGG